MTENEKIDKLIEILEKTVYVMQTDTQANKDAFSEIFYCLEKLNNRLTVLEKKLLDMDGKDNSQ